MQENGEMPVNAEFAGLFFFGMAQFLWGKTEGNATRCNTKCNTNFLK
ncbi:MAG TPA: hypothetical protein H9763_01510 [Candidatus Eisenbergiella merdigallinarum]|uniref:Uncharacterized protein n=1 Tax=Candidatus Eisenbergiella merdigallinarum TaxID=2838552 RepID=A0A9D2MNQ1_9FIRM|nr:hypothetical protein [Candidatus Eisenbergiella merdigallinarum]